MRQKLYFNRLNKEKLQREKKRRRSERKNKRTKVKRKKLCRRSKKGKMTILVDSIFPPDLKEVKLTEEKIL